jgi:transposase
MYQKGMMSMANPISNEKRSDIVKHLQAGESMKDVAKWYFVCVLTVKRIWNKFLTSGSYEPEPLNRGRKPKVSEETMDKIVVKIKEKPDMTLHEIIDEFNLGISKSALCRRLNKLGLTVKKNILSGRTETR